MGKPTAEQLEQALAQAAWLRENDVDEHFLGKSLLNHNYRLHLLEDVQHKAKLYLHSGSSAQAHRELLRAIEKAEAASRDIGEEDQSLGH
ncbi:MAG: hypothetical protein KAG82_07305 [Alcanivoracaceae bacterium]|jgi:hypothetical protein|nr:hypothetical protein [Alcanivoracaceae bacterium]